MKIKLTAFVLTTFCCALSEGCQRRVSIPVETLEITPLLELSSLSPKYKIITYPFQGTAVDQQDHVYFIDQGNHRILKFNLKGGIVAEIGGIGQGTNSLFSPDAIAVENESLYVLNDAGREVKIFSLDGEIKSSFVIDNAWISHSLFVDGDSIFVNVIDKYSKKLNDGKLISVYDHKGRLIKKIGPIIKCNSLVGYREFNSIRMSVINNEVYYAFNNQPLISWCDRDGGQNAVLDLRKCDIPEIAGIIKKTDMSGFDTPETIKEDSDLKLTLMRFCYGFGVDESGGFYYALNTFESASPDDSGSYILYFNEKQELAKKIYLKTEGETVVARNLLIPRGHARYGIGTTKEKILLFKF